MHLAVRLLLVLAALGSATYAVARIPVELETEPLVEIASRLLLGSDFDPKSLERFEPYMQEAASTAECNPLRGPLAIVRTYRMQQATAVSADDQKAAQAGRDASRDLRRRLACSPSDGMAWFSLFMVDSTLTGRAGANLPLLRMSYAVTPYEGWITQTRGQVAPALLPFVDARMRDAIRAEFRLMLRDNTAEAASVYARAADPLRNRLLPLIDELPAKGREDVAAALHERDEPVKLPPAAPR